jgi:hypothetical protein
LLKSHMLYSWLWRRYALPDKRDPEERDPEERRELLAGRYRVDGLLGRGGMSEVYEGYDERLDRSVAIKVLRPPAIVYVPSDSPEAVDILDALDRDRDLPGRWLAAVGSDAAAARLDLGSAA